ncbi:MAG: Na/Pi cotransporter family protein [Thermodesulfobacteriota bacterium]|nr:Na/Pi cotransporter family protein [Thermodesulfobacteriota bacterium]
MTSIIFQSLGGLGLFLFGMKIMSEGLQKVAGKKIRQILNMVSNNRFVGCAMGAFITSIIQSSSAATVMLVSFVDAGLMNLVQATGVILGANVGTTVTAQLIAFKIEAYALPAIAAGVILKFFVGRRKWIYIGDVLLGFGLVFFGLATMKAGFAPLKQHPAFVSLFTQFNADDLRGILLCVMVGTGLTMILQSSSATVGVTMALATQGLLNFDASVALILGDNIGTTITAELACVGSSINAHRTARAHTLFNVIGVINVLIFFPYFIKIVTWVTSSMMDIGPPDLVIGGQNPNIARYIANSHTMFNLVNALFFLMVLPYLVKVAIWLTPHRKDEADIEELHHIKYMDTRFISTPSVALGQARAEIIRMGEAVLVMYDDVVNSLADRKLKKLSKWKKREDAIDNLQREIIQFLTRVMQGRIIAEESKEVASLMRMANNFERIGDEIEDVAELLERLMHEGLYLSETAEIDYQEISDEVKKFLVLVVNDLKADNKNNMPKVQEIEGRINIMRDEMKAMHISRLQSGVCSVDPGMVFVDMLNAFEEIGGYCYNIGQSVAGIK